MLITLVAPDKIISICHVSSKDHMFKGLPDFIGEILL